MGPEEVPYKLLREITDDFCEQRKVGQGAFGTVYKGVTKNGDDVAVKILPADQTDLDHRKFRNEFYNLKKLKHNNIVQVLAYCYETEKKRTPYNGKTVLVEVIHRALCFEYFHNGSLQKYLSAESCGLDWHTRYKIIMGICDGLKYIHMDLEQPLLHLDLKPDNILLDENMVPKIADFGLSMIFSDELTRTTQSSTLGTPGYQPPEHIESGEISKKFDIFSLGAIIIKIVSGQQNCLDEPPEIVINQVQSNWRKRWLEKGSCGFSLEACAHQVKTCTQIALDCLEKDNNKRPDIVRIIEKLNGIEYDINELPKTRCETVVGMTMHNEVNLTTEHKLATDQLIGGHNMESCNRQETLPLDVGKELIVGREKKLEEVVSLLESKSEKFIIYSIYGIGGIGKTTFARLIYNHKKFKCYSQAWVHVSRIFDLPEIHKSIDSQLSGNDGQTENILVVLDDLWEDEPLTIENLRTQLYRDDEIKIIVLVTTRRADIAQKMCMNIEPYKIEPLTDEMCWEIIKEKSGFQPIHDKEKLEATGKEIAQKCRGIALAAQSLGSMLLSMSYDDWMTVKDSYIWGETISKDNSLPNHVLQSLKLSYHFSMDKCLQSCFTYWAFFPKGHEVAKDDLIYQWMSLGSVTPTKMMSPLQRCEKNIADLIGLAFLQHSLSPTTYGAYGEHDTVFTMHDLVHDLAIALLDGKVLDQSRPGNTRGSSCVYAWFTDCDKRLESCMASPSLLALRFLHRRGTRLDDAAFELAVSLRVLDLSGCTRIQKLPPSFYKLKSLEYVDLRNCINAEGLLEFMNRLTKLQYLNLSNCKKIIYFELARGKHMFGELRYLNLSDSGCLSMIGKAYGERFLGSLTKLEYLNLSSRKKLLTTKLPEALGTLTELKYLNIAFHYSMKKLPASFGNLCNLVRLDLSCCYSLQDVPTVLNGLTKLQYLNLYMCSGSGAIEGLEDVLGNLSELRHLNFSGRNSISEGLLGRICSLTNLEHLVLSECDGILSIPETISNLSKLHTLDLRNCHGQWRLPASSISKMDSLKFLYTDIMSPQCYDGQITVHESARDELPVSLKISRLENVKSAKEVKAIKLEEKIHIQLLYLEWTTGAERLMDDEKVLRELEPPKDSLHLKSLYLKGYRSVSFPSWVMHIDDYLPSLIMIDMSDLPRSNKLPPLGQLPNLFSLAIRRMDSIKKIDVDLYGGERYFPRLEYFTLDDMKCLEEWNSCLNKPVFPCLKNVAIRRCPRLRFKARLPPCIDSLQVHSSDEVMLSSWGNGGSTSASAATCLHVEGSLVPLHQWSLLRHLPCLKELSIENCRDLSCSSPNFLRGLTYLTVKGCESSVSLPEWLGGLTSLRELEISDYKGLKTLPDSIKQLTCLRTLTVSGCESITALPGWLGGLTSLRRLDIFDCEGIKTLPDSIQKLNRLQGTEAACGTGWARASYRPCPPLRPSEEEEEETAPPTARSWLQATLYLLAGYALNLLRRANQRRTG